MSRLQRRVAVLGVGLAVLIIGYVALFDGPLSLLFSATGLLIAVAMGLFVVGDSNGEISGAEKGVREP